MSSDLENLLYGTDERVRTMQLIINSKDRVDPDTPSTAFRVNLQNPVNSRIIAYGLESCTIAKTSYNISAGNNEFEIEDSVGDKTVTIPVGNYNSTTFITTLNNILNSLTPDSYTVVRSTLTGKLSITSSFTGFVINPVGDLYPLLSMLGFPDETILTSVSGVLDADNIMDISGPRNLYIKIAQLSEYMRDTKNLSSNFKIDYGCNFGDVLYFSNQSKYLQYYTTAQNHLQKVDHFNIELVDENNAPIDLNGSNWSFVLRFITKDLY